MGKKNAAETIENNAVGSGIPSGLADPNLVAEAQAKALQQDVPHGDDPDIVTDEQRCARLTDAFASLIHAFAMPYLRQDPNGEIVEESVNEDGETVTVTLTQANRFAFEGRSMLNQLMRQFSYLIDGTVTEMKATDRQIRGIEQSLQRSVDPDRLVAAKESKERYFSILADKLTSLRSMQSAAEIAYLDLVGDVYTAPAPRTVTAVAAAVREPTEAEKRAAVIASLAG